MTNEEAYKAVIDVKYTEAPIIALLKKEFDEEK